MTTIFRKTFNLKNVNQFKFLLRSGQLNGNISQFDTASSENHKKLSFGAPGDTARVSTPSIISDFLHFVKKEDADRTLKELQKMKKGFVRKIPINEMTKIIDLLQKNKKIFDLGCCVQVMSYTLDHINPILKPLLEKHSTSGDIDSLEEIAKIFPDFALIKCSFNFYLTKAYISSKKYEDLFLELEKRCESKNKLFSVYAFDELLKIPDFEERIVNLAKKYLQYNVDLPLAVVWAHYLTNGKFKKADEFFKTHSIAADKVDMIVLKAISQQKNVTMGKIYICAINQVNARSRCKERAYGTLLDVLVSEGKYDDATALIIEAKNKEVCLENHYRSTLIKLKTALEKENKDVVFTIPSKHQVEKQSFRATLLKFWTHGQPFHFQVL